MLERLPGPIAGYFRVANAYTEDHQSLDIPVPLRVSAVYAPLRN